MEACFGTIRSAVERSFGRIRSSKPCPTFLPLGCLLLPFQGFGILHDSFQMSGNFALYSLDLGGYTRRRRRGRVVEGAPLLRE